LTDHHSPRKNFYLVILLESDKTADMKCAAVAMAVSIAFASQALAVCDRSFLQKQAAIWQ
jgi:hypothetical protein